MVGAGAVGGAKAFVVAQADWLARKRIIQMPIQRLSEMDRHERARHVCLVAQKPLVGYCNDSARVGWSRAQLTTCPVRCGDSELKPIEMRDFAMTYVLALGVRGDLPHGHRWIVGEVKPSVSLQRVT